MENVRDIRVRVAPRDAKMFVFGDGLSDTGRFYTATRDLVPPSPPYFEGRFSNGLLAVENLADSLGLTLTNRTNFATTGATTGRGNLVNLGRLKFSGLQSQVNRFNKIVGSRRINPKALYVVWVGGDELLSRSDDRLIDAKRAADNVAKAVTKLADFGARNILVVQNPNLGRTPFSLRSRRFRSLTRTTLAFNDRLESTLTPLEIDPDLNIVLSNLFPVSEDVAQNPSKFGLSNLVQPYLRPLRPRDSSVDLDTFLYWDRVYPTRVGHEIFADTLHADVIETIEDDLKRIGTELRDRLTGFAGDDRLAGLGGRDILNGNGGRDFLLGGRGLDFLNGRRDDDSLLGGLGRDLLRGEGGRDRLFGQDGRDRLLGGNGVDFLSGGLGDDLLKGGRDCDLFSIGAKIGTDTIQDFKPGKDLLFLRDNLSFDDLDLRQRGKDALVAIADSKELIAVLENVKARVLGTRDFLNTRIDRDILDLADPDARGGILEAIKAELSGLDNPLKPQ